MNPDTLKMTTLDPKTRQTLRVTVKDDEQLATDQVISELMGKDVARAVQADHRERRRDRRPRRLSGAMALDILEELDALVEALTSAGVDYAVCGGLALAIHGYPRMTQDIDVLVQAADVARVVGLVRPLGFDIPARAMTFGLRTSTPRQVQRISKLDPGTQQLLSLDLLHVSPDLEPVWSARLAYQWRGRGIQVVSRAGLVTMKRIAGRPQDLLDISTLEGTNDDDQEA